MSIRRSWWLALPVAILLSPCHHAQADGAAALTPTIAIPGLSEAKLDAAYWIARTADAEHIRLVPAQIDAQNARLLAIEPSMQDLHALPKTLRREQVRDWIRALSQKPTRDLFDDHGAPITPAQIDVWMEALALDQVARRQPTRFALVTRRADLRTFPTRTRVFSKPGETDIDRFQESALFPGTAVVIAHQSRDQHWLFVIGTRYAAWIESEAVAFGARATVLDFTTRTPALVVTGSQVRSVYTPEAPALSEVTLDMGVRVPLLADWPVDQSVNGQAALAHHVIELPVRRFDGALQLQPALLPRSADVARAPLALSAANLLRQSFKFIGERYGWGHAYNARDCSGFVSEVYASLGILLPRNTSAQSISGAFDRLALGAEFDRGERIEILRTLEVGDLIYIPGHVMMVIGHDDGGPWVIHDTNGASLRHADGKAKSLAANGVIVTPFALLAYGTDQTYIDAATAIQRIRSRDPR